MNDKHLSSIVLSKYHHRIKSEFKTGLNGKSVPHRNRNKSNLIKRKQKQKKSNGLSRIISIIIYYKLLFLSYLLNKLKYWCLAG